MTSAHLHQTLKSLCLDMEWNYAVFWKLQHRTPMVLSWEDAYYDNCRQNDPAETMKNLQGRNYSHELLGLALARMSYNVHSLGEGSIGQVAVTGRHKWFYADEYTSDPNTLVEYVDGWQNQFSAGIRTIVVVPVFPLGVLQLGSLNKIVEDMKLVTQIRDVFFALQDLSVVSIPIQHSLKSLPILPDLSHRNSSLEAYNSCMGSLDNNVNTEQPYALFPFSPYFGKHSGSSYIYPQPGIHQIEAVEVVNNHRVGELSIEEGDEDVMLHQQRSDSIKLEHYNQIGRKLIDEKQCEETNSFKVTGVCTENSVTPSLNNSVLDKSNIRDLVLPAERYTVDAVKLDGAVCNQNELSHIPISSEIKLKNNMKPDFEAESSYLETSNMSLEFTAGCELHEALGPGFLKSSTPDWRPHKIAAKTNKDLAEEMSNSQLTFDAEPDHLLQAVVEKFFQCSNDSRSEKSLHKTVQPPLVVEKIPGRSLSAKHSISSSGYSIDQRCPLEEASQACLTSSEVSGFMSSKGYSSTCPSTYSEQLEGTSEPTKHNRKRARPGENCRPRPRDRQLIQDRIKDLRDLVPSGAKCSIDSLLERTIKHMVFLQSITKHADKLNECADTKLYHKEASVPGTSHHEQGSSWAVEVGSHLKVCSIIVENLNKNGQMLVEMLCEESSYFLEIAEAIRSLDLTILKGVTEEQGEKTWICFVVEGQENKSIHRMDILWSLVQVLQPTPKMLQ